MSGDQMRESNHEILKGSSKPKDFIRHEYKQFKNHESSSSSEITMGDNRQIELIDINSATKDQLEKYTSFARKCGIIGSDIEKNTQALDKKDTSVGNIETEVIKKLKELEELNHLAKQKVDISKIEHSYGRIIQNYDTIIKFNEEKGEELNIILKNITEGLKQAYQQKKVFSTESIDICEKDIDRLKTYSEALRDLTNEKLNSIRASSQELGVKIDTAKEEIKVKEEEISKEEERKLIQEKNERKDLARLRTIYQESITKRSSRKVKFDEGKFNEWLSKKSEEERRRLLQQFTKK